MKPEESQEIKKLSHVICPVCGTKNTTNMVEPKKECSFCGNTIVMGEKSGL